jgi:hypothetical protein
MPWEARVGFSSTRPCAMFPFVPALSPTVSFAWRSWSSRRVARRLWLSLDRTLR